VDVPVEPPPAPALVVVAPVPLVPVAAVPAPPVPEVDVVLAFGCVRVPSSEEQPRAIAPQANEALRQMERRMFMGLLLPSSEFATGK
jgi:hypothetical protein